MDRWENAVIRDIHISRYIASWMKVALSSGKKLYRVDFRDWLRSLELSKEEVDQILFLYDEGKLELETSARTFIKNIED